MKLKTKKLIAREFLLLIGIVVIAFLIYGMTFIYNAYFQLRINSFKEEKQTKIKVIDSLKNTTFFKKRAKQKEFFQNIADRFEKGVITKGELSQFIWGINKHDPKELTYAFFKKKGFQNLPISKNKWLGKLQKDSSFRRETFNFLLKNNIEKFPESQIKWESSIKLNKENYGKYYPNKANYQDKMNADEFAAKIKQKYPQYRHMNNTRLAHKILHKYPSYKDDVNIFYSNSKKSDTSTMNYKIINKSDLAQLYHKNKVYATNNNNIDTLNLEEFWVYLRKKCLKDNGSFVWKNEFSKDFKEVLRSNGIANSKELNNFIQNNTITKEQKKNKKMVEKLKEEKWNLRTSIQDNTINQLNSKEKRNISFYSLIALLLLAYPIRFFLLGLRWSILTLRKDE